MRTDADKARIERLLTELGKRGNAGDRVYVTGGTSAVEAGWREFTQDVDIRIESENDEPLLRAISELKDRLDVNVELASPLDFLPAPPGWTDRSPFIARVGAIRATFVSIEPELYRFPAIDATELSGIVKRLSTETL